MDNQQERDLIEQMQAGSEGAFERLYESYKDQAYRTAVFLTGNTADAQDVVQDTFVTVCIHIKKLKEAAAFRSWFYRILTHNAMHLAKRRKREIPKEDLSQEILGSVSVANTVEDIADILTKKEENKRLRKLISEMDEKHRTVLVLYYYNDFSVTQIAQITGCLAGTVKSRLYHARKQLEQKLREAERR